MQQVRLAAITMIALVAREREDGVVRELAAVQASVREVDSLALSSTDGPESTPWMCVSMYRPTVPTAIGDG